MISSDKINAARGKIPCDLVLKNAKALDVFSGHWLKTDLAIHEGEIVGLDPGYEAKRTIDLKDKAVVPGFIDAHVHIESSAMIPGSFEQAVLSKGTTTAICDPHELANVQGLSGIEYFLKASEKLKLNLRIMLSSCVPATHLETNGGGTLTASDLKKLKNHPNTLGLAEVMNVPGVLNQDPALMEKLELFGGGPIDGPNRRGPIDGHAPLLRGQALSAYACAGISSCHESSELNEAKEKLSKGLAVWIREGSVAKDLEALWPILSPYTSATVGFCTDDRNPLDIATEGHIDHLIRVCLKKGVPPETVYRAASWSVANHYGLNSFYPSRIGAISPGYVADLVILEDIATCAISDVYRAGVRVSELDYNPALTRLSQFENSIRTTSPNETDLKGPEGQVHTIGVLAGKILTESLVTDSDARTTARLSVLERYGRGSKPANAYVQGFGENFNGAIASSVGHDSHNLIVAGTSTSDMKAALSHLISTGGGFCVVKDGAVLADLALPLGGLMSPRPTSEIIQKLKNLRQASLAVGCALHEPFLQLAFLSLPVIPSLKLTDKGLVDVNRFDFIDVRAS